MGGRSRRSKKRSAASSHSTTPPKIARSRRTSPREFFADECVAQLHIGRVITEAGHIAHLQRDVFPPGTQDVDWLPKVGELGWILITKDERIRKRDIELHALIGARVRAFVLTAAGEMTGRDQAEIVTKALPQILRIVKKRRPPFVANITASGHVDVLEIRKPHRRRTKRAVEP